MEDIRERVQVHIPFRLLAGAYRDLVIREGIHPEIAFDHGVLDGVYERDAQTLASELRNAGRRVTFHAPFLDLRPGAVDPRIRAATKARLDQVFDLVPLFRPLTVVCHACFDPRYYPSLEEEWLDGSQETWGHFVNRLAGTDTVVCLENVYETRPRQLARLLKTVDSPRLRFCFDAGHCLVLSRVSWEEWVEELGPFLRQVHLHDNQGRFDEHLPVGEGIFPFPALFAGLRERGIAPIWTVEAHKEEHLWQTLRNLDGLREGF